MRNDSYVWTGATPPHPPTSSAAQFPRDAACRRPGVDPAWFFPEDLPRDAKASAVRRARATCESCPVRAACEAFAAGESFGIWAGRRATRPWRGESGWARARRREQARGVDADGGER